MSTGDLLTRGGRRGAIIMATQTSNWVQRSSIHTFDVSISTIALNHEHLVRLPSVDVVVLDLGDGCSSPE